MLKNLIKNKYFIGDTKMIICNEINEFSDCSVISLDFETESFVTFKPIVFSIAGYSEDRLDDKYLKAGVFEKNKVGDLLKFLPNRRVAFHNMKFDCKVLVSLGFDIRNIRYEDTMLMAHLLDESQKVGLKVRCKDVGMDLADFDTDLAKDYVKGRNVAEFIRYSMDDAIATIKLFWHYREKLKEEDLVNSYILELKTAVAVMWMELFGIRFDFDKSYELEELAKNKLAELEDKIYAIAGRMVYFSAPNDLASFLFDDLKIEYKPEYSEGLKTKSRSVRKEVLDDILLTLEANNDSRLEIMNDVMEIRRLGKMLSSFFVGHREAANLYGDGRIHSNFNQVSTVTGRFASSDPNLQQLPTKPLIEGDKNTSIRSMYVPSDGNKLIVVDYSQIELRLAAHFSEDDNMIRGFLNGEDFHQRTVEMSGGIIDRRTAKIANFGKLYGMNPYGFAMQAKIPIELAYKYYAEYNNMFPGIARLENKVVNSVLSLGYIRMIGGRKRRLQLSEENFDVNTIKRVFLNSLIQGSAAVILKMTIVDLMNEFYDRSDVKLVLQVHDELVLDVASDVVEDVAKCVKERMENVIQLRVPLEVEPVICNHYGEAK